MSKPIFERRKYSRFGTDAEVHFRITFDVRTKVKYQIVDKGEEKILSKKYTGFSRDVSAEGIRFTTPNQLEKGDLVRIEVYVMNAKKPIMMDGEVRWSDRLEKPSEDGNEYETGVKLITCNQKMVADTIHMDNSNKVAWSAVLESVVGDFKKLSKKRPKS